MTKEDQHQRQLQEGYAARLMAALDLMELGIEIMRQNIIRRRPDATPQAVGAELQAWILGSAPFQADRKTA